MRFFYGLHQPSDAKHVSPAFISVNRVRNRVGPFVVDEWIMDSGAFMELLLFGQYRHPVAVYAEQIKRWATNGKLLAAVAQDYMREAIMLAKTGLSIEEHQRLTIERYDDLLNCDSGGIYIMPVLQGYAPSDYVRHIEAYGPRLDRGAWVGVGSVCKRNGDKAAIEDVLLAIKGARPDLRLHGFGIKTTALGSGLVRDLLHTADSMAWSYSARKQGRNGNDWREAARFGKRIATMPVQDVLFGLPE
jgi:hypothetical protein